MDGRKRAGRFSKCQPAVAAAAGCRAARGRRKENAEIGFTAALIHICISLTNPLQCCIDNGRRAPSVSGARIADARMESGARARADRRRIGMGSLSRQTAASGSFSPVDEPLSHLTVSVPPHNFHAASMASLAAMEAQRRVHQHGQRAGESHRRGAGQGAASGRGSAGQHSDARGHQGHARQYARRLQGIAICGVDQKHT